LHGDKTVLVNRSAPQVKLTNNEAMKLSFYFYDVTTMIDCRCFFCVAAAYENHSAVAFNTYKLYTRFLVDKVFSDFNDENWNKKTFRTIESYDDYYSVRYNTITYLFTLIFYIKLMLSGVRGNHRKHYISQF
jgi:hypothetical protein